MWNDAVAFIHCLTVCACVLKALYSYCTFLVWITFKRKQHDVIQKEVNRSFSVSLSLIIFICVKIYGYVRYDLYVRYVSL